MEMDRYAASAISGAIQAVAVCGMIAGVIISIVRCIQRSVECSARVEEAKLRQRARCSRCGSDPEKQCIEEV